MRSAQHFGSGNAFGLEQLLVVAEAERARVDADRAPLGLLPLPLRPIVEIVEIGRLIFDGQPFVGRLLMRVARAAPPDVALRIGGLGLHLRIDLARALARHGDRDAGLALEGGRDGAAPLFLHTAIHHEISGRLRRR